MLQAGALRHRCQRFQVEVCLCELVSPVQLRSEVGRVDTAVPVVASDKPS